MQINKKLVKYNFTKGRSGKKIEYIVIHDTGNENPTATAIAHYNYFNSGNKGASAHYFVDEKEIVQIIEDSDTAWHCGDRNHGKMPDKILNSNSIGIEICINDGNYETEIKKTIELTKYLMDKYKVPFDNVVRHYDASKKPCPAKLSKNNWEGWKAFKAQLQDKPMNKVRVNIKGKVVDLDGVIEYDTNKNATNYVSVRQLAEAMGYKVDWDNANKVVLIK